MMMMIQAGHIFCTCHNSSAVVTCAKLWSDWIIVFQLRPTWIFTGFGWWAHELVSGLSFYSNGLMQDCGISSVSVMEISQCCTKPFIFLDIYRDAYYMDKTVIILCYLYTVYSRYIAVVYIAELDISRSHVGPHFFGAQERDIFCELAVTPWTQFAEDNFFAKFAHRDRLCSRSAGDNFSRNHL